ncbi:fungal peroxidase [Mycena vulgaris]|nr:fungal peroxidase [Mycena vulgaris]
MKLQLNNVVLAALLSAGLASALAPRHDAIKHTRGPLQPRRTKSLLISPAAQPELPTLKGATAAASAVGMNLTDIQGDILIGMKKKKQLFYFFSIADPTDFKPKLADDILPLITTTTQMLTTATQPITALNIAFSQTGLNALNVTESLGDAVYSGGQFKDLNNLGDPGPVNWVPEFADTGIHGVILFASDTEDNIDNEVANVEAALGDSITKVYTLSAASRPDDQSGHEHFGFQDGISNPAVTGFTTDRKPGQALVDPGTILLGEGNDVTRPSWAKDGSFLVFRQLKQLVPEFHKFLTDNPIIEDGLTREQGSALLGARMVGRWPSGAPLDLSPKFDDPELGANASRNNDFTFFGTDQNCPFGAHIRKTRPRSDLGSATTEEAAHHIMRAGIPYGPEVSTDEAASNTTSTERGLAFVSYQSNIAKGFQFIQHSWANSVGFLHGQGADPIIGALAGAPRTVTGLDPTDASRPITLTTDFVVSRGGEYFFSPSLSAIASKLSV